MESNDASLVVAVSGSAARKKNGPNLSLGMYAAMAGAAAVLVYMYLLMAGQWTPFLVVMFVLVALVLVGFIAFVWLLTSRTANIVQVTPLGVVHDMFVGPLRLVHQDTPWAQVSAISLEPASAIGRVKYVSNRGPAYVGVGVGDEDAEQIFGTMTRYREDAVPAEHA